MSRRNNNKRKYNNNARINNACIRANRTAAIFALIIVIMWSFNVQYVREYEDIIIDRYSVANAVSNGTVPMDKFAEDYQKCIERMDALRESSKLGEFFADNDEKALGRFVNYMLVATSNCGMIVLSLFIIGNVALELMYAYKKCKRRCARMKKQREAENMNAAKKA